MSSKIGAELISHGAEYVQSAHCTDNGLMGGLWDTLKQEMYYGKKFTSGGDLITAVESYIRYYNTKRVQRKMHLMTPAELRDCFNAVAQEYRQPITALTSGKELFNYSLSS